MACVIRFSVKTLFFAFLSVGWLLLSSPAAQAQTAAVGCNQEVMDAQRAMAQARRAEAAAVTAEIIPRPDSVLAMTCFNQAASVSAFQGGQIFSGDFRNGLAPVANDAMGSFYPQFQGAIGYDTGTVDYSAAAQALDMSANPTFNCNGATGMNALHTQVRTEGPAQGAVYATKAQLVAGTSPGAPGSNYNAEWDGSAAAGVFTNLDTSLQALPQPCVPSYSGATGGSTASVLSTGAAATCP